MDALKRYVEAGERKAKDQCIFVPIGVQTPHRFTPVAWPDRVRLSRLSAQGTASASQSMHPSRSNA